MVLIGMAKLQFLNTQKVGVQSGVGEAVSLKLGSEGANLIIYKGQHGVVKFADWSGDIAPPKEDENYLGAGTFGIAQRVVASKVNSLAKSIKAFKTPSQNPNVRERANEDVQNEVTKIEHFHRTHPGGRCPGIQKALTRIKMVRNGEVIFSHLGALYASTLKEVSQPDPPLLYGGFKDMFHGLGHMHNLNAPWKERAAHMDLKLANCLTD